VAGADSVMSRCVAEEPDISAKSISRRVVTESLKPTVRPPAVVAGGEQCQTENDSVDLGSIA
jgi:hypothetical protein